MNENTMFSCVDHPYDLFPEPNESTDNCHKLYGAYEIGIDTAITCDMPAMVILCDPCDEMVMKEGSSDLTAVIETFVKNGKCLHLLEGENL